MRIPTFRKVRTQDADLNGVQDQVSQLSKTLAQIQLLDGSGFENVQLTAGTPKALDHKLDRPYIGYIVVRKSANADIWDTESETPRRTLVLNASANCTISIWVF